MTYATPAGDAAPRALPETPRTLFINGSWEPAASGAVREIHNPADGELVATVSEAGREDAERAIEAARAAFDSGAWSGVPAPERGAHAGTAPTWGSSPCSPHSWPQPP